MNRTPQQVALGGRTVREFQAAAGLRVDGIAGPLTRAALAKDLHTRSLTCRPAPGWPVLTKHPRALTVETERQGRWFGAPRDGGRRLHAGVDLYCYQGDVVVAMLPGVVTASYLFYRGVWALLVHDPATDRTINYGEVMAGSAAFFGVSAGSEVQAGQPIALIGKMRVSSMLHLEIYAGRQPLNMRWYPGKRPAELLDPTEMLTSLASPCRETA